MRRSKGLRGTASRPGVTAQIKCDFQLALRYSGSVMRWYRPLFAAMKIEGLIMSSFAGLAPGARQLLVVLLPFALSACESSDVASVTGATPDKLQTIRVSEVAVTMETPKPNPLLEATLKEELEKAMPRCARGTADHRMEVAITDFEEQDVGKAIMIGDEIELEGRVRFVDPATETLTGEYFVENSFYWGGLLGAAMMSDPERRLSRDFAKSVCEELFGVEIGN